MNFSSSLQNLMEESLRKFLKSFNKCTEEDFVHMISLLQNRLMPRLQKEQDIIVNTQKMLENVEQKQQYSQLVKNLSSVQPPLQRRANVLYVLMELKKHQQQVNNQISYVEFDFHKLLEHKNVSPPIFESVDAVIPVAPNTNQPSVQTQVNAKYDDSFPSSHAFLQDLLYLLQGVDGKTLRLEISTQTGLLRATSNFKLQPNQAAFLQSIAECGGIYVRLMQLLKSLEASGSNYRREFCAAARDIIQQRYRVDDFSLRLQRGELGLDAKPTVMDMQCFVNRELRGVVTALALVAEAVQKTAGGPELIAAVRELEPFDRSAITVVVRRLNCLAKRQAKEFIFEQKIAPEFFVQKNLKEWDEMYKTSDVHDLQAQTVMRIGRAVGYCRDVFKKFLDFQQFAQLGAVMAQLDDACILMKDVDFAPLEQFVNEKFNRLIVDEYNLYEHFDLVRRVFFGFQSDFISSFCALQQERAGDLYRIQCENDLDFVVSQSNLASLNKSVLQKLGVALEPKQFSVTFEPAELGCVFTAQTCANFARSFRLIVALRRLELSLVALDGLYTFKLNGFAKIVSNFLQLKLQQSFTKISNQLQESGDAITNGRLALQKFNQEIETVLYSDQLQKVLNRITALYGQYKNQENYLIKQKMPIKELLKALKIEILKEVASFVKEARSVREEEAEGFVERVEAVGL